MYQKKKLDVEDQLYLFQIFGIVITVLLCLVLTISVTVRRGSRQQEESLLREATTIAKAGPVLEALEHDEDPEYDAYLRNYLDIYIRSISDLDFVAICDKDGVCRYYPNKAFVVWLQLMV